MWSSVVLLECDVVALSLDEQNNISLSNFTPVAYSGPATFRYASPHHNNVFTKRSMLNNASVWTTFSFAAVYICEQDIGPILSSESQMTLKPRLSTCTVTRQQH